MILHKFFIRFLIVLSCSLFLISCNGKLPGADSRKFDPDPAKRVQKNLEEGRGFKLMDLGNNSGGVFQFANSNELWRASLDIIDFMPLVSANYSGGIIITDWYSEKPGQAIKITLRFLTNEIRSDAIEIKIFFKNCSTDMNCKVTEQDGNLKKELKAEILKKAALYEKEKKEEKKKK